MSTTAMHVKTFNGCRIKVVDTGTEITNHGRTLVVDDRTAVQVGMDIYVNRKVCDALETIGSVVCLPGPTRHD